MSATFISTTRRMGVGSEASVSVPVFAYDLRGVREAAARGAEPAADLASAANPILLVIPCHRVVGADGSLKGYAGGIPVKERLLDFEAS